MGKLIFVPELSCCHVIHHNFQFKALICFCFIARGKHASFPGELSHVHYSFCAVWRSVPEWAVKSWKTVVWEWQKAGRSEILLVYSTFRKGKLFQVMWITTPKMPAVVLLVSPVDLGDKCIFRQRKEGKNSKLHNGQNITCPYGFFGDLWEKHRGRRLRCLKPTCFATYWIVWLCKKVNFSLLLKQLDVKTLDWGCLFG